MKKNFAETLKTKKAQFEQHNFDKDQVIFGKLRLEEKMLDGDKIAPVM